MSSLGSMGSKSIGGSILDLGRKMSSKVSDKLVNIILKDNDDSSVTNNNDTSFSWMEDSIDNSPTKVIDKTTPSKSRTVSSPSTPQPRVTAKFYDDILQELEMYEPENESQRLELLSQFNTLTAAETASNGTNGLKIERKLTLDIFLIAMTNRGLDEALCRAAFHAFSVARSGKMNKYEYILAMKALEVPKINFNHIDINSMWLKLRRKLIFAYYNQQVGYSWDEESFMTYLDHVSKCHSDIDYLLYGIQRTSLRDNQSNDVLSDSVQYDNTNVNLESESYNNLIDDNEKDNHVTTLEVITTSDSTDVSHKDTEDSSIINASENNSSIYISRESPCDKTCESAKTIHDIHSTDVDYDQVSQELASCKLSLAQKQSDYEILTLEYLKLEKKYCALKLEAAQLRETIEEQQNAKG